VLNFPWQSGEMQLFGTEFEVVYRLTVGVTHEIQLPAMKQKARRCKE